MATSKTPVCQEITTPMCRGISYNLKDLLTHNTQDQAGLAVHQF